MGEVSVILQVECDNLADSRARASSLALVLRAVANGSWPADDSILRATAGLAGRLAIDLARLERDADLEAAA